MTATPPDADAWLASALDPGPMRHAIRRWQSASRPSGLRAGVPDAVDGVDESTFTDVMRSQYDETARLVNELIEAGIQ